MTEKRNENKIMAMLERKGVVRKVGVDDDSYDDDFNNTPVNNGSDIKTLIDTPDDVVRVTPAARQPVPGIQTNGFQSENPSGAMRDAPRTREHLGLEMTMADETGAAEPVTVTERSDPPISAAEQTPSAPTKPASSFSALNIFRNDNSQDNKPAVKADAVDKPQQPENYTDRFLSTDELYDALALRAKKTDTIYLIEEYLQTLPDSLPDSSRREIVGKLIAASGFDFDLLMGDGVLRVKMLKEYAERFARHTDDYITARQAEIDEMEQQILRSRKLIDNRRELHKKQFFSIEAEAQRLKEILTFVSG